ncbi:NUDIX domain-containing protein [Enterovirga sp.]|uniref:NUDIX domain-containing protein n=1 Tax=Enterovirga sp. TaxID=2026350 RepID=UPI002CBA59E4|nr:NUDIX domain-containing protein [Enterovirga sp.]HMO27984.1 NUDIX domain-containing protein [Enterovirga sp.]
MSGRAPLLFRALHAWFLVSRGLTLGVRGAVIDEADRVLLIRHTYVKGWHLPGGGVEIGETALDALGRELREEANIELTAPPVLRGICFNTRSSRRDHVLVYEVRAFRQTGPKRADREIAEAAFFDIEALPEGTTESTRTRLAEIQADAPVAVRW